VVFTIDHDLNVSFQGHDISHVKGSIRMGIATQAAKPGTVCGGGTRRRFTVALTPVPGIERAKAQSADLHRLRDRQRR
jgi:hypothetical protein